MTTARERKIRHVKDIFDENAPLKLQKTAVDVAQSPRNGLSPPLFLRRGEVPMRQINDPLPSRPESYIPDPQHAAGISHTTGSNTGDAGWRAPSSSSSSSGVETDQEASPPPPPRPQSPFDGANFVDDEMTLDFDDEDDTTDGRRHHIYQEYQGEDFSQYLEDDDVPRQPNLPRISLNADKQAGHGFRIKNSIARLTNSRGTGFNSRKYPTTTSAVNNFHDFTYADSQMGRADILAADGKTDQESSSWWSKETLGVRTIGSNSDVMLMKNRSASTSHLNVEQIRRSASDIGVQPGKHAVLGGEKAQGEGLWNKFTNTLRRPNKKRDNTTTNPFRL